MPPECKGWFDSRFESLGTRPIESLIGARATLTKSIKYAKEDMLKTRLLCVFCVAMLMAIPMANSFAEECSGLPTAMQLQQYLTTAPSTGGDAGGLDSRISGVR